MDIRARAIFVTNNGLSDHIGIAQVLPYLIGLAEHGHRLHAISVEDATKWREHAAFIERELARTEIDHQPIWRSSNAVMGKLQRFFVPRLIEARLRRLASACTPDLIHCRSYMPLPASLRTTERFDIPLLFDTRGFWIDQRIEGGTWKTSHPIDKLKIAFFRNFERKGYRISRSIVTLTQDAKAHIESHDSYSDAPIEVIPCSVDQSVFDYYSQHRQTLRNELGYNDDTFVLAYLGSTSGVYRLDLVYRLFDAIRAKGKCARLLFLGNHNADMHIAAAGRLGVRMKNSELVCRTVQHEHVPRYLSAADIGLSLIIPSTSSLGVSATKVGEYLSCGLPVISNQGVGDIHRIICNGRNGFILEDDTASAVDSCASAIAQNPDFDRQQIRQSALDRFSLEGAVTSYSNIYKMLADKKWVE